ncbi:MAG TPA: hypothetical protein VGY48_15255 [Vicinamibacterales bacterium]|jgi:hypothetical protein|nr:hypothetical protein [Vicinamibacterales bacterium]
MVARGTDAVWKVVEKALDRGHYLIALRAAQMLIRQHAARRDSVVWPRVGHRIYRAIVKSGETRGRVDIVALAKFMQETQA